MKNTYPKFKINETTYLMILSFLFTGFIKNCILIFTIILFHELGHIFFLKWFHYPVEKVEIFPFGGLTTTNKYLNSPINQDILIYLGGVLFQIILYGFFFFLLKNHWLRESTFEMFTMYNKSIFLFNLLPIKSLDGGEIFSLLLQKHFPYLKTLKITKTASILALIGFTIYNIQSNLNNYIVITFLIFKTIDFSKKIIVYQNKFLLERYIHTFPYKKIEHNSVQNTDDMKKETLHFFKEKDKYLHEREILKRKFDRKTYF